MSEEQNKQKLPESWLFSENFLKRAFGVWGHNFVAQLIISAVMFAVALVFLGLSGIST